MQGNILQKDCATSRCLCCWRRKISERELLIRTIILSLKTDACILILKKWRKLVLEKSPPVIGASGIEKWQIGIMLGSAEAVKWRLVKNTSSVLPWSQECYASLIGVRIQVSS